MIDHVFLISILLFATPLAVHVDAAPTTNATQVRLPLTRHDLVYTAEIYIDGQPLSASFDSATIDSLIAPKSANPENIVAGSFNTNNTKSSISYSSSGRIEEAFLSMPSAALQQASVLLGVADNNNFPENMDSVVGFALQRNTDLQVANKAKSSSIISFSAATLLIENLHINYQISIFLRRIDPYVYETVPQYLNQSCGLVVLGKLTNFASGETKSIVVSTPKYAPEGMWTSVAKFSVEARNDFIYEVVFATASSSIKFPQAMYDKYFANAAEKN